MHPLNKFFEHVYCINLITRKDRKELIQKRFDKLGIEVEFYTAIDLGFLKTLCNYINQDTPNKFSSHGEIGCAMSHYTVIKMAKDHGYKNVLILEDDTVFDKNFNDVIESYLKSIPIDWNMIYLTTNKWEPITNTEWMNSNIFRAKNCLAAAAYGVNSNFYNVILNEMDRDFRIIDKLYTTLQNNNFYNIYACYPNLTAQGWSKSDLTGGETNYYHPGIISYGGLTPDNYE